MRGEAEAAHGFLDAPLVVEVRDARPLVRRSHGCVDVVFDAGLARQRRKTLALRLFPLDARLRRVLHAEDAPRAGQRTAQRRLVIKIALDDADAVARQRRRPLAVRLARQAAQIEPGALQRLRDRAALIACHSGDENRSNHMFPSLLDDGSCESCWVNQVRACTRDWNNPAKAGRTSTKITAHSTATKRASGGPLGAIKAWKTRMLTITGASTATANGT